MKKDDRKRSDTLTSILGGDTAFEGTLRLEGSLRIDGSFEGTLTCGGSVAIGEQGSFTGDIDAEEVILGGQISGRVVARKLAVLEASSTFEGELACGRLHVNEGAVFNGTSVMGEQALDAKLNETARQAELPSGDVVLDGDPDESAASEVADDPENGFHFDRKSSKARG